VRALGRRLGGRLARHGLHSPQRYAGLDEAGRLDLAAVARALQRFDRARAGTAEINAHPGECDPDLERFAWGYRWSQELGMLRDPATAALIGRHGFRLGSMDDLRSATGPRP
jgi:hypothetical protein